MTEQMLDYYEFNSHHNKVIRVIRSCETLDQLENSKEMINFFINNNAQNDKIPFAKNYLLGALSMRARTLNL